MTMIFLLLIYAILYALCLPVVGRRDAACFVKLDGLFSEVRGNEIPDNSPG
jgi:hypothetical protein